jgi:hypothetical protein
MRRGVLATLCTLLTQPLVRRPSPSPTLYFFLQMTKMFYLEAWNICQNWSAYSWKEVLLSVMPLSTRPFVALRAWASWAAGTCKTWTMVISSIIHTKVDAMVSSGEIMENKRPLLSMPRRPDTILPTQGSTSVLKMVTKLSEELPAVLNACEPCQDMICGRRKGTTQFTITTHWLNPTTESMLQKHDMAIRTMRITSQTLSPIGL